MALTTAQRFQFLQMFYLAAFHQEEALTINHLIERYSRSALDVSRAITGNPHYENAELSDYLSFPSLIRLYSVGREGDFFGSIYSDQLNFLETFTPAVQQIIYRECIEHIDECIFINYRRSIITIPHDNVKAIVKNCVERMLPEYKHGYFFNHERIDDCQSYADEFHDIFRFQIDCNIKKISNLVCEKLAELFQEFISFRLEYLILLDEWINKARIILAIEKNIQSAQAYQRRLSAHSFSILLSRLESLRRPVDISSEAIDSLLHLGAVQRPFRVSNLQWERLADLLVELKEVYNLFSEHQLSLSRDALRLALKPRYLLNPSISTAQYGLFRIPALRHFRACLPQPGHQTRSHVTPR